MRRGARARYMGGKKRPEKSIRSARKDGICVSAVGDQRIGSSRSAGVSLGHARSESHSSGARSSVPPRPAAPEFASSGPRPCMPLYVPPPRVPLRGRSMHRTGRYSSLESGPRPFYRTRSYGFSMRGRTTDIDRLITCLRGGSHGPRRRRRRRR